MVQDIVQERYTPQGWNQAMLLAIFSEMKPTLISPYHFLYTEKELQGDKRTCIEYKFNYLKTNDKKREPQVFGQPK